VGTVKEIRFWPPSVTSQVAICPVPFHVDTYKGCPHGCLYCFGRDLVDFQRRGRGLGFVGDVTCNDPANLARWVSRNYGHVDGTAANACLNDRIPLKVGAVSDPCPAVEADLRVTESLLATLRRFDYPVQVQTKNPGLLLDALRRLGSGMNLVVSVTVVSMDRAWSSVVEPGAPDPADRMKAIRGIVKLGYKVMVKVQPIVPPSGDRLRKVVYAALRAGAWAFNTEGLKFRRTMPAAERTIFDRISPGIVEQYLGGPETGHVKEGSDLVMSDASKRDEYLEEAAALSERHGLAWYSADNRPLGLGAGPECCGTRGLPRHYRVASYNWRSEAFGSMRPEGRLVGCRADFMPSEIGRKGGPRTIREVVDASRPAREVDDEVD
jgi:DNA repair photolyase